MFMDIFGLPAASLRMETMYSLTAAFSYSVRIKVDGFAPSGRLFLRPAPSRAPPWVLAFFMVSSVIVYTAFLLF